MLTTPIIPVRRPGQQPGYQVR